MPHPFLSTSRRGLLKGLGGLALGAPLLSALRGQAANGQAERVIFFYFPDGVVGPSQNGEASLWHCTGSETNFQLSETLQGLSNHKDRCVFFNGLSMGGTDSGSHPGGAKKLLTAADYGNNESIDQYLARTAGWSSPWRHLLLGVQANYNNASGDKHISYPVAGSSLPPQDDPRQAFADIFGSYNPGSADSGGTAAPSGRAKVIGAVKEDLLELRSKLGGVEKDKLDYHVSSLEELENRLGGGGGGGSAASCGDPAIDTSTINDGNLYDAGTFPAILRAQTDLMVLAMECGITRVGTIQCASHTSELLMSRFAGTDFYDPNYDMRSHQASHYGASHDRSSREFSAFLAQRKWWVQQYAYLLDQLAARPEGDGTMLDHSIVVLVTEVCDGNTHLHDNMPFVLAGGAGGRIRTGRLLQYSGDRHGNLWVSVGRAMGQDMGYFGDSSSGPLWGLVDG
jgi:hypothetical protein